MRAAPLQGSESRTGAALACSAPRSTRNTEGACHPTRGLQSKRESTCTAHEPLAFGAIAHERDLRALALSLLISLASASLRSLKACERTRYQNISPLTLNELADHSRLDIGHALDDSL
jgi:hypothetical protein